MNETISNLEGLLDRIDEAAKDRERISLGTILDKVGNRSFGPLLLAAGMIAFSPLSGIPGMPTFVGVMVLLIALQMLIHRRYFWLPDWLLNRSIGRAKLLKAIRWLRRPSHYIDYLLRPRLSFLVRGLGVHGIATVCVLIALVMPVMELIPFSATTAGFALTILGLALIANDGLLALLAFSVIGGLFVVMVNTLV